MDKHDALRFKVSVSPVYTELFEAVKLAGPYYRSRRLLNLALIGLAVERSQHSITSLQHAPAPTIVHMPNSGEKSDSAQYYNISDSASKAIAGMLDSF
jgi:hypothetical protein